MNHTEPRDPARVRPAPAHALAPPAAPGRGASGGAP